MNKPVLLVSTFAASALGAYALWGGFTSPPPAPPVVAFQQPRLPLAQIEEKLEHLNRDSRDPKDRLFGKILPKSGPDSILKRALIASNHARELGDLSEVFAYYQRQLNETPAESIRAIAAALQSLPIENHYFDRASLISAAAKLDLNSEDRSLLSNLARQELQGLSVEPMSKLEMERMDPETEARMNRIARQSVLPISSYQVLLKTSPSAQEAISATLEALKTQANLGVRQSMVALFAKKFPDEESRLRDRIQAEELELDP